MWLLLFVEVFRPVDDVSTFSPIIVFPNWGKVALKREWAAWGLKGTPGY